MENVTFNVNVIGYNADVFRENYAGYIKSCEVGVYDDCVCELCAPVAVRDEIATLVEEGITIV